MSVRKSLPRATDFSFSNVGLSVTQAEAIWLALKRAVEEILEGNNAQLRFEELYRNAYTLVLHKHGEMLYKGVEQCITKRLERVAAEVARSSDAVRHKSRHKHEERRDHHRLRHTYACQNYVAMFF